ncbi:hypothetical protein N665_0103s0034 [Sinapis alba]|nr:hypothetical protein N665_0103s0034 [Sinapis alba]
MVAALTLSADQPKNIALSKILENSGLLVENWEKLLKPLDDGVRYKQEEQRKEQQIILSMNKDEKRAFYEEILDDATHNKHGALFIYVLEELAKHLFGAYFPLGIFALLLEGGRTAHSRFNIPINMDESTSLKIPSGSDLAKLLQLDYLIVWDEAPIMNIIRSKEQKLFGGKVIVFGGDFCQILPVIPYGGRTETNMRFLYVRTKQEYKELRLFSVCILVVGDGNINNTNDRIVDIDIPDDLLIKQCDYPIPTIINDYMPSNLRGKDILYHSLDSIEPTDVDPKNVVNYPVKFLNSIKISGFPKHELKLRVGAVVMCMHNINPPNVLCNRTKLMISNLSIHAVNVVIMTGSEEKSSHGQLYVAFSREKSMSPLKILISNEKCNVQKKNTNDVYKKCLKTLAMIHFWLNIGFVCF